MTCSRVIHRAEGDEGPPITVEYEGQDITAWTVTARFIMATGEEYTLAAVVDNVGVPASDVPAQFHFVLDPGKMPDGDQEFDIHLDHATLPDFSLPLDGKFTLRVRDR